MSYLTEDQQVELLKKLWKEYGLSIITGVVLAVIVVFGWRFYQTYRIERAEQASTIYEHMMVELMNDQNADAKEQAETLQKQFHDTPYATFAALMLAKLAVEKNDWVSAKQSLQWVMDHGSEAMFREIATIRLAKIDLQERHSNEALKKLSHPMKKTLIPLAEETKGDAYQQLNQVKEARSAYQQALAELPESALNRPFLQLKLADLPAEAMTANSSTK